MKDTIVEQVRQELLDRSELGIEKYKTTLDRTDLTNLEWLQHWREEMMDGLLYATRLKKEMLKQNLEMSRLKGEFHGMLKGLIYYDIPTEVKERMKQKIDELENGNN